MSDRNIKIALIVGLVVAALAILWYASSAAYAQEKWTPACVPAYTQDPKNNVGGQLASLTILPLMLPLMAGAVNDEHFTTDWQKLKGICTTLSVMKHAAGLKDYAGGR